MIRRWLVALSVAVVSTAVVPPSAAQKVEKDPVVKPPAGKGPVKVPDKGPVITPPDKGPATVPPGDKSPSAPGDKGPTQSTPPGKGPVITSGTTPNDPVGGRYRVTLNGFSVLRQTYDNPLQIDGKGDEIYFATYVAVIDTASEQLLEHSIVRSRDMGDMNGFAERVKMGYASGRGGIRTNDKHPLPVPYKRAGNIAPDSLPMLLWEGELVQGQSAVVLSPTVWEWDDNPELFGYWVVSRHTAIDRLTEPEMLLSIINNRSWFAQDLGSPGFLIHTNMIGDARDRPIGMELARSATGFGFVSALSKDARIEQNAGSIVEQILRGVQTASPTMLGQIQNTLVRVVRGFLLNPKSNKLTLPWDGAMGGLRRSQLGAHVQGLLGAATGNRIRPTSISQAVKQVSTVIRDYTATDLHFIEKTLVLTPVAIEESVRNATTTGGRPRGAIDVQYFDHAPLGGRYILHLQVEKLP